MRAAQMGTFCISLMLLCSACAPFSANEGSQSAAVDETPAQTAASTAATTQPPETALPSETPAPLVPAAQRCYVIQQNGMYGLMDGEGRVVVEPQYKTLMRCTIIRDMGNSADTGLYSRCFSASLPLEPGEEYERCALLSPMGEPLTDAKYSSVYFDGNAGYVGYSENGADLLDSEGKVRFKAFNVDGFSDGMMAISNDEEQYYYLNTDYEKCLGPYDFAGSFMGGNAVVWQNGRRSFIDKQGQKLLDVPMEYEADRPFCGEVALVFDVKNYLPVLIDKRGEILVPTGENSYIDLYNNGFSIQQDYTVFAGMKLRDAQGAYVCDLPAEAAVTLDTANSIYVFNGAGNPSTTVYHTDGTQNALPYYVCGQISDDVLIAAQPETLEKVDSQLYVTYGVTQYVLIHSDGSLVEDLSPFYFYSRLLNGYYVLNSEETADREIKKNLPLFCSLISPQGKLLLDKKFRNIYETDGILAHVDTARYDGWVDMNGNWVYRQTNFDQLDD